MAAAFALGRRGGLERGNDGGAFGFDGGLLFNPLDMGMKNVSNTGVLMWAGRLLSLYEVRV